MSSAPIPVVFEPILKSKIWGGRKLSELFSKSLPAGERIGESWELVQLPKQESRVRDGPMAGKPVSQLAAEWGDGFLGGAAAVADGRLPLLVKFLDARQNLSVQVHPKPRSQGQDGLQPGVKHECWYVIDAEKDAEIFVGLQPGVTREDLTAAAGKPDLIGLLHRRRVKPGYCFFLPSGVVHSLGAGVVVAEIQTPADVTYRLYDWDRVGSDGRPRELHIEEALANARIDVPEDQIRQPRRHVGSVFCTSTRMVACDSFVVEKVRLVEGMHEEMASGDLTTLIVLSGRGVAGCEDGQCRFASGDVLVIPAGARRPTVETETDCEWLEVKIPLPSTLSGYARPPRELPPRSDGMVTLTRSGKPAGRSHLEL